MSPIKSLTRKSLISLLIGLPLTSIERTQLRLTFDKQQATIKKLREQIRNDKYPELEAKFLQKIEASLQPESRLPSTWFYSRYMKVCLRIGHHFVDGQTLRSIDIVNIEIYAQYRGRGLLRKFVAFLSELALHGTKPLYVENVHMPDHYEMWEAFGFTKIALPARRHFDFEKVAVPGMDLPNDNIFDDDDIPRCFIKYKNEDPK